MMDIRKMFQDAFTDAIRAASEDLLREVSSKQPLLVGSLPTTKGEPYSAYAECGRPATIIDTTAVVIDEDEEATRT